nr:cytochrome P450 6B2-like [Maniola hyperantus]
MNSYYIFLFIIILILIILKYLSKNHDYWEKRNVPYLKPTLLFGNYKDAILLKSHQTMVARDICKQFPNEPYIGTFYGTAPALILLDPNLIKLVLVTDFYFFSGREVNDYSHKETITKNVFFTGGDAWKIQRQNLTPLYSSSKIKGMFHLIQSCATQLEKLIDEETKYSPYIDAKTLLRKFTIDTITSCTFGINANTLKKKVSSTNPFVMLQAMIFDSSKFSVWPALFYGLGFKIFDEAIHNFFRKILREVFESRANMKSSRNDFVDQILSWKKGNIITGESMSNLKTAGLRLRKGDRIHIPLCYIHRDPKHFSESEEFRPERFYGDAKKDIKPYTFFPFGEGPRLCLGMRFSKMPLHAGLLAVFRNYRVELAEDMPRTVQFQPYSFVITSAIPIKLKFISRTA